MSSEVRAMIDVRHQAEQRGHFEPLGRLLWMATAHGTIKWPAEDGEAQGPDVALGMEPLPTNHSGTVVSGAPTFGGEQPTSLLLLGPWLGLPPVRVHSETPCPKCRHACDVCDGGGKKQCEMVGCGGNGWVPGPWQLCQAPNCSAQKGAINPAGCMTCRNSGQVPVQLPCPMCHGSKVMTCPRCKGSGKISTGFKGGSLDWKAAKCAACDGSGFKGAWQEQDIEKFTNALLSTYQKREPEEPVRAFFYRVLGPVSAFCISDHQARRTRVFDVTQDSSGDFLNLLIPSRPSRHPEVSKRATRNKAYLVGGVVRERVGQAGQVA